MAVDYLKGNANATFGGKLINARASLNTTMNLLAEIKATMVHNNNGSDWTTIESLFGLPSGKGQTVYDLVNGMVGSWNGTFQNNNTATVRDLIG